MLTEFIHKKIQYFRRVRYSLLRDYRRNRSTWIKAMFIAAAVAVFAVILIVSFNKESEPVQPDMGLEAVVNNYGDEVRLLSHQFDIDQNYLMALIMLESSGRADVPQRFEKGVYKKLKDIQDHKQVALEGITLSDIKDASDEALRNLASSWGPFQLMGYKCLHLDIKIKDLRGSNSLYWGVYWIDRTYGDLIRAGRYEDAFHFHNTGHPVPKSGKYFTYDPQYVPNGMAYMKYFEENFK